jgi:mannosyl-3-phosphoglycerate phosphatase
MTRTLVVTDLDGCLLDPHTYSHEEARPALAALARARWPLVLCTGKTKAEVEPLWRSLQLAAPYVVENGGAVVFPTESFEGPVPGARRDPSGWVLALGFPRARLVEALAAIAAEARVVVRGFASMSPGEVQSLTGLAAPAAALALRREFDEPFLVEGGEEAAAELALVAARYGLTVSHGGRFHHLAGGCDKGLALRSLLANYARAGDVISTIGLGDAETDLSLLRTVDRPIVVPGPDGRIDPALAEALPGAERAPRPGPAGWNEAILTVLGSGRLPGVALGTPA